MERIALVPDLHCNDHDPRAVELACKIIETIKPDRVIFLGDVLDYGWASFYPQNQGELKGIFAKEVAAWEKVASAIRSAAPNATFDAVMGNHEYRLHRGFLWTHPQFSDWRGLSWREILSLDKFRIRWHTDPAAIMLAGRRFVVTHGFRLRVHSGGSALSEIADEWGCSGASGHTHRLGQVYRTLHSGIFCWTECGHLQNRRPKYAPANKVAPMNWQQGMVVMHADSTEFRVPDLIPFWRRGARVRARYFDKEFQS